MELHGKTTVGRGANRRRPEEDVRSVLHAVITTQEEERHRVACELDDEAVQTLTSVLMGLRQVEETVNLLQAREAASDLRASVSDVLGRIGRIASGLRPSLLDDLGLEDALHDLADEVGRSAGLAVDLHISGAGALRLSKPAELAIYRIAQEALTNTGKHASAKAVSMSMHRSHDTLRLVIEDDGTGFDATVGNPEPRCGLLEMRERAHLVGGGVTVESSSRRGTSVFVSVPLPRLRPLSIRVFIADDHVVLRGGLRAFINAQPDMEVVGEAASGPEAEVGIRETAPDVALIDISMPGGGGIAAIANVKQASPKTRTIVLTGHDQPGYVRAATDAGAVGYVVKNTVDTALIAAIRTVDQGQTFVNAILESSAAHPVVGLGRAKAARPRDTSQLSSRERIVIGRVAEGLTNCQIADELELGVRSIEACRTRAMEKLGLTNRAELVRFTLECGVLDASKPAP
jgi:two-component system, NarL family, response regulator NreC